jgi:hypothetical protein
MEKIAGEFLILLAALVPSNSDSLGDDGAPMLLPGLLVSRRRQMGHRRDWAAIIDRLNQSRRGEFRVRMGSPGSAQVTRCRLLANWSNLEVTTVGSMLRIRLRSR